MNVECPKCDGDGRDERGHTCRLCGGDGVVPEDTATAFTEAEEHRLADAKRDLQRDEEDRG